MSRLVVRCVQRVVSILLLCWTGVVWASAPAASTIVIRRSNIADVANEDYYFYRVLELALHKTNARGKQLLYRPEDKRLRNALMQGRRLEAGLKIPLSFISK